MIKDPLILFYFGFPLILIIEAIVFIDRKTFKSLFWFGLIWGSVLTTLLLFIFDNFLNLVKYQHAYPFTFYNSPLLFNLGWTPAIMMFIYFLPNKKIGYAFYAYLLTFSLLNAVNDEIFHQLGLLVYIHWSPFVRLIISLPYFYLVAVHYLKLKEKGAFKEVS